MKNDEKSKNMICFIKHRFFSTDKHQKYNQKMKTFHDDKICNNIRKLSKNMFWKWINYATMVNETFEKLQFIMKINQFYSIRLFFLFKTVFFKYFRTFHWYKILSFLFHQLVMKHPYQHSMFHSKNEQDMKNLKRKLKQRINYTNWRLILDQFWKESPYNLWNISIGVL